MTLNILITGVGGQGTILMSRLLGAAAVRKGLNVRGSETIGMAQRGGSVVSHIRVSSGVIHSPLIPPGRGDLVIALEPAEGARALPFLAPPGRMIVLDRGIIPVTPYDPPAVVRYLRDCFSAGERAGGITVVGGEDIIARCGSPRVLNIVLLGAALSLGILPFGGEDIMEALGARIAPGLVELNRRALEIGMNTPWN
ncbi:MAG: indolepyruvate oxidoreductase subunit beta [Treponema sp.]|jgi:indolepyruvate ferredoxin oxidoreductase beta subunit|nr:indolepyruvate oxidoreductase subunit beta [Treponema sp.]